MGAREEPRLRLAPLREVARQLTLLFAVLVAATVLLIGAGYVALRLWVHYGSWEMMEQTTSPDGRAVATVWRQNFGAWDDFTTIGTLHHAVERPTPHDGFRFFIADGYPRMRLEWGVERGEPCLCVDYLHDKHFRSEPAWGSMPIFFHRQ
jgi:hypothetical protein